MDVAAPTRVERAARLLSPEGYGSEASLARFEPFSSAWDDEPPLPPWLARYTALGFSLLFWPRPADRDDTWKGPRSPGWQTKDYPLSSYQDGQQIGVKLGVETERGKFLADFDIDWTPGIQYLDRFLTHDQRTFTFGRASKPLGHLLFTTSAALTTRYFDDAKVHLGELRGLAKTGLPMQTVVPPSLHKETGDVLTLGPHSNLPHDDTIPERCTCYFTACLLGRHWPKNGPDTNQHEVAKYAAAFLCKQGVPTEQVATIIEVAAALGGDDNVRDRVRAAEDTVKKFLNGVQKLAGAKKLIAEIGHEAVDRLREWWPVGESTSLVVMRGGELSAIVDRSEAALLTTGIMYQRGGLLTRAIKLDKAIGDVTKGEIRRAAGSTVLIGVNESWLIEKMGQVLSWVKVTADGQQSAADPRPIYARTLLSRGEWRFPVLRGVITAPTLAFDGRIIEQPGFDAASGLLVDIAAGSFPAVPIHPSKEDALRALETLSVPLRGFPFVPGAKAVALSAMLTALVRGSLRTAPLHGFDAPKAGTGKSLLAEAVGLLAMGVRPPAMSQGKTPEEDEKRLSTVLFAGDPVIHLDNCKLEITGDFLCSMLSQEIVQARILGLSERRILPTTAVVLASGNNLTFAGDTARRATICRLDAQVERPDERVFDFDCHAEILKNRPDLVIAGLTMLRAYHVAGRPTTLMPMGEYRDWEWIRGALVWLGCDDPAATHHALLDDDPEREELIEVMDLWQTACGTAWTTVADIHARAEALPKEHEPPPMADIALRAKLIEVGCKGKWSAKSVGWWMRAHKDNLVTGRVFRVSKHTNPQRWKLLGETLDFQPVTHGTNPYPEHQDRDDGSPF